MQILKLSLVTTVVIAATACGGTEPAELVTVESERALQGMEETIGVTVDPVSGEQYVLDNNRGLLRVGEGEFETIASITMLGRTDFTDVVALGDGRFAMTVMNDGFLLDLSNESLEQFFCYLPGEIIEEFPAPARVDQVTNSLAYDAEANVMFAQPQTFITEDGETRLESAQIGEFDARNGGEGYGWINLDKEINAGGLAVESSDTLLLGVGTELHRLRLSTGDIERIAELDAVGIGNIDGITALADGRLSILDGDNNRLVTIRLNVAAE